MVIRRGSLAALRERVRRFLGGVPPHVQVAALPWRESRDGVPEVMLVTSRGTGRWVLPKGWPEKSEPLHEAAAREAAEEAGVAGPVGAQEIGRFHYGKMTASGAHRRCEVRVFPLHVESVADKWPERKERTRHWFAPEEAAVVVEEAELRELIAVFAARSRNFAA